MSPELTNFLFEAVNLLLLAAGLGWFFFKPVRTAIDVERAVHVEQAQLWDKQKAEAESLLQDAKERRAAFEQTLERDAAQAKEAARNEARAVVEAAKAEAAAQRERLLERMAAERQREVETSVQVIARIAGNAVHDLLMTARGPELNAALIRVACERVAQLAVQSSGSVTVETATALGEEAQHLLRRAIQSEFVTRIVPELGLGVRVMTDVGQIDASARGIARTAADQVLAGLRPSKLSTSEPEAGHA